MNPLSANSCTALAGFFSPPLEKTSRKVRWVGVSAVAQVSRVERHISEEEKLRLSVNTPASSLLPSILQARRRHDRHPFRSGTTPLHPPLSSNRSGSLESTVADEGQNTLRNVTSKNNENFYFSRSGRTSVVSSLVRTWTDHLR